MLGSSLLNNKTTGAEINRGIPNGRARSRSIGAYAALLDLKRSLV